eukprot:1843090-Pleurochrysis_carterae.AAC.1
MADWRDIPQLRVRRFGTERTWRSTPVGARRTARTRTNTQRAKEACTDPPRAETGTTRPTFSCR